MELLEATTKTAVSLKNILFATDLSEASEAALPFAMAISRRYGGRLHATHVTPEIYFFARPEVVDPVTVESLYEAARRDARERMDQLGEFLDDIPHQIHFSHGQVWEALSSIIRENEIDLLVIGTHGRTGMGKLLMGSVAEEIVRKAKCPVLTVGPNVRGKSKERILQGNAENPVDIEFQHILYATDFKSETQSAAPYAISLAKEFGTRLSLLHVFEEFKDLHRKPGPIEMTLRRLEELVPEEAGLWCSPVPLVRFGVPADCILQTARDEKADLIVLGVKSANGYLGSATHLPWTTAHKVITEADCPVLTVRD